MDHCKRYIYVRRCLQYFSVFLPSFAPNVENMYFVYILATAHSSFRIVLPLLLNLALHSPAMHIPFFTMIMTAENILHLPASF